MLLDKKDALIIVDVQNDFVFGSLAVPGAVDILPNIKRLIYLFDDSNLPIFLTRCRHPKDHCSFKEQGGEWPPHCVEGTEGSAIVTELGMDYPPELYEGGLYDIVKGQNKDEDAYSAFKGTDLQKILQERGVKRVFVCGLATDFCVKNTVLDALSYGYSTVLVADAVAGVFPDTTREALHEMFNMKPIGAVARDTKWIKAL